MKMKVTVKKEKVNVEKHLFACYDVSQSEVHFVSEYKMNGKLYRIDDNPENHPCALKNHFLELEEIARQAKFDNIHVFFEPSGGQEKTLKRMAQQRGYLVNQVSGEATKKARVIESNDGSKSDEKDKCTILTLAKMSKVLSCRELPKPYSKLRILGEYYDDASNEGMILRNKIASVARELFHKLSLDSDFFYSATGSKIIKQFGFNPHKITKHSLNYFISRIKRGNKNKLKDIYRDAMHSKTLITKEEAQIYEEQLLYYYLKYEDAVGQKLKLKEKMCEIYKQLPEYQKLSKIKDISDSLVARLIAETGPLSDFKILKQIMRYAGLNIRVKESGKYKGENKISKKGRPLLRKILYQIVFTSTIRKGQYYHDYHASKKEGGTKGLVIMVNIMRKLLRLIFGFFNTSENFKFERIHKQEEKIAA